MRALSTFLLTFLLLPPAHATQNPLVLFAYQCGAAAGRVLGTKKAVNAKYGGSVMALEYVFKDFYGVEYLTPAELKESEIHFDKATKSWVYAATGNRIDPSPRYTMVMSQAGKLYIRRQNQNGRKIRHSGFLHGEPVGAGGHVMFSTDGNMTHADFSTGHYFEGFQTPDQNWVQFVHELIDRGYDPRGMNVDPGGQVGLAFDVKDEHLDPIKQLNFDGLTYGVDRDAFNRHLRRMNQRLRTP